MKKSSKTVKAEMASKVGAVNEHAKATDKALAAANAVAGSRHKIMPWLIGAAAAMVIVIAGWALASVLLMNISVGGAKVRAHRSDAVLAKLLDSKTADYRLAIAYPDHTVKKFPLSQLGLSLDASASIQATRAQQSTFRQRLEWWRPVSAVLVLHENMIALNNFVTDNVNIVVQPSQDASLTIKNDKINLTGAITGRQYGLKQSKSTLVTAARSLSTRPIALQTLTVNPALTADLLEPYKTELEQTINQSARFTIGGQIVRPSPAQIASWLDIAPNDKSKKLNITVNSGKISAYINSIAAAAVQPPRAQVVIRTSGGTRVLVPGVSGVGVVNQSGIAKSVAQKLLIGKGFSYSLPVGYEPFTTITAGDYPKWIEVDLTNKVLYAYEHGTLVNTFLVSAGAPATPTVTGQYKIYAKYVQQNMSGENVDGSSYFQPNVPWVNYFYSDFAIHGNYWRPVSYFGHINSSHGCVGLLDDNAEWVYNWAPIGTPVIVHA